MNIFYEKVDPTKYEIFRYILNMKNNSRGLIVEDFSGFRRKEATVVVCTNIIINIPLQMWLLWRITEWRDSGIVAFAEVCRHRFL